MGEMEDRTLGIGWAPVSRRAPLDRIRESGSCAQVLRRSIRVFVSSRRWRQHIRGEHAGGGGQAVVVGPELGATVVKRSGQVQAVG
jgi:hypothetical protein